jgi:hypothetical protein
MPGMAIVLLLSALLLLALLPLEPWKEFLLTVKPALVLHVLLLHDTARVGEHINNCLLCDWWPPWHWKASLNTCAVSGGNSLCTAAL